MRILAIRGSNLASLAGEFELDLAGAPLGGAGVFAIVGNTGSGKSTLLDAMCVALFDRTPRLCAPSRVQVGRGPEDPLALGASDVRTLLRRGAAAGYAEVDFESGDARRYRARWAVRRARGRGDGALQDQQITLTELAGGERLGGTKTETLRAIQQRLGLSFEQFRRSALLAQGEFAAFLRADSKDRSELLERMTGTEIYSRLSVAAHLRAAAVEARLREGRAAALAISVRSAEARLELAAAAEAAVAAQAAARARAGAALTAAAWSAEAARRAQGHTAAEVALAAALGAEASGAGARAELALARRAEALRPLWTEVARAERALAGADGDLAAAANAAASARARRDALVERRATVAAALAPVRAARIAAGLIEHTSDTPTGAAGATAVAALAAVADDAAWLTERAALASEIAAWPQLEGQLAEIEGGAEAIAGLDRSLAGLLERRASSARARGDAKSAHVAAQAAHGDAQRKAASFRERRGLSLDAARRAEDAARERGRDVDRLVQIAADARAASQDAEAVVAARAAVAAAEAADRVASVVAENAAAEARLLRDERARAIAELRRIAGYEHARAELVDGEPCPLCGAETHPWAERGAIDEMIRAAEARLAEAVAAHDAALGTAAELGARAPHHARESAALAGRAAELAAALAAAEVAWRTQLAALGELPLVVSPRTAAAEALAAERAAAARSALEVARAQRAEVDAAAKATAEAQAQVLARQADLDELGRRLADLDAQIAELDATSERVRGERAVRAHRQAELDALVATALERWRAAGPAELPAASRGGAAARATPRIALAAVVDAWRRRARLVCAAESAGGRALAACDVEVQAGERAVAETAAGCAAVEAGRAAAEAELATARAALLHACAEAELDATHLTALLAAGASRVEALAGEIAALARGVDQARAVVAERARLVAEHAAARPAAADWAVVAADAERAAELVSEADAADAHAARLAAELAADEAARSRQASALAEVGAAEHAAEAERALAEVIGSHDGKLFRSFAQSLTLDGLLAVANAHLEELAPRYQLERVPRHDLELQVIDRDLGNEIRSVQSLSGGESFLVSLALALGLSSMSAHDVRVRTLLIDEGFGTLDPSTLDSALAVLDRLQATGRQVGVISHVPALVERVGAHVRVVQRGGGRSEVIVAQA